jgi:hypothetical protein
MTCLTLFFTKTQILIEYFLHLGKGKHTDICKNDLELFWQIIKRDNELEEADSRSSTSTDDNGCSQTHTVADDDTSNSQTPRSHVLLFWQWLFLASLITILIQGKHSYRYVFFKKRSKLYRFKLYCKRIDWAIIHCKSYLELFTIEEYKDLTRLPLQTGQFLAFYIEWIILRKKTTNSNILI